MEERPPPRLKKAHRRRFQSEPPVEALESLFTFAREDSDHTLEQANLDTNDAEGNMVTILEGRQHRRERSSQIPTGWDKLKGPAMERVKKDRHRRQGSDVPTGFDELPAHRRQRSSVPSGVDELPERERTPTNNRHRRNRSSVPTGLEGLPAMSPITSMFDEEMPLKQPSRPRVGSRYMNLAKRVNALKSTGKLSSIKDMYATEASVKDIFAKEDENEPSKEGAGMFGTKNADNQDAPTSHTDNLLDSALNLNQLFEEGDKISIADTASSVSDEMLPLTSADVNNGGSAYGSISGSGSRKKKKKKVRMAQLSQFWCLPRSRFGLAEIIHPKACMRGIDRFLRASSFTYVAVPSLLMAALVYYHLGNPSLNFLPGDATVSWWLIFIARQALTLELAIAVEYFAVEGLALRTKWMVYMCGPLVTLWFINAKGWPLVAILWSLNDLVLLHGNSPFQQNWFFFLDIGVFSEVNKGGDFLYSEFYLRFLMSMLLGGTCHAIKRTHVAMTFGKRTLQTYKASMETILADIVLISEVAELARELEYESANSPGVKPSFRKSSAQNKWKDTLDVNYQVGIDTKDTKEILGDDRKSIEDAESSQSSLDIDYESDLDDDESDSDGEEEEDDDDEEDDIGDEQGSGDGLSNSVTFNETIGQVNFEPAGSAMDASVFSSGRTTGELKRKLDRWQEPKNKLDKSVDASIADILKFRRALTYMDDPYPFGDSFGQGATRNECIKSAQKTYRRLIRSANQSVLSYDVIKLLAVTDDGDLEEVKDLRLRRLFRPTRLNELSLLAFVQTCDTVYKKLRYFRASVGNSSVINKVLESIVDSIVNFVLALVILTILQYNPYPILVSLSTIMVSLAFAMGPSASKYIEGILLIAIRRPFDIGDRILVSQPFNDGDIGMSKSWFVEDINLWCTTLRYAKTNEVATINNGALSSLRVVNCNRSPDAMINIDLKFDLSKLNKSKMELFRLEVEQYLVDRPRVYKGIAFFRCEILDHSIEMAQFQLCVRHSRTWQDAPIVLFNRGELMMHCMELGEKLGINIVKVPIDVNMVSGNINQSNADEEIQESAADVLSAAGAVEGSVTVLQVDGDNQRSRRWY